MSCLHGSSLYCTKGAYMKKEKTKKEITEQVESDDARATDKGVTLKKMKKKRADEVAIAAPKPKKAKSEKSAKVIAESKEQAAQKDDKLTKFLVSMKKSVRKSIKKEAAEAGVSMNAYIVSAVEAKVQKESL